MGLFETYEDQAMKCIEDRLIYPAYDYILKSSHSFNILDASGAIGVSERAHYIKRVRNMARDVAKLYYEKREELGFPLLGGGKDE